MKLLYDISKSFEENFQTKGTINPIPPHTKPPKSKWYKLFGYKIASQLGIAACPLGISKNIKIMSKLGFDVLTYKTIRSHAFPAHPHPNICYVNHRGQIKTQDIEKKIYYTPHEPNNLDKVAISNSFGNASLATEIIQEDIQKARKGLSDGQVLIVSVFGSEQKKRSFIDDFAYTAQLAQEAGAHIVELNLSCPNIKTCTPMHQQADLVYKICKKTQKAISIPFIIKVGIFEKSEHIKKVFIASGKGGAQGICGINAIQMQVVTENQEPYFGKNRILSGISGDPIRSLTLDFIQNAHRIINQEKLDLVLLATGGLTKPAHFDEFFNAGATIAMSATGSMWNPYLAMEYHRLKTRNQYESKKERINQSSL